MRGSKEEKIVEKQTVSLYRKTYYTSENFPLPSQPDSQHSKTEILRGVILCYEHCIALHCSIPMQYNNNERTIILFRDLVVQGSASFWFSK